MASFTQRTNGRWQAKIRRDGWPDQSKAFRTLDDAQKWARAIEREMDIGAFVNRNDAERTTFKAAAGRYAKEVLPAKAGVQQGTSLLKKLVERFGPYSLASINPAMLAQYRDDRLKIVSAQTVVHELGMMSRVFKTCALDWGIALPQGIPTALVRKPKVDNARERRLDADEWELLSVSLGTAASPHLLAVVEFAIETAARQSEIMSLTWENVDLKNRTARLRGVSGLKTKNGDVYREIPLSPRAVSILAGLTRPINGKGKVFRTTQSAIKQSWERSVDRARQAHVHTVLRQALTENGLSKGVIDAEIRAIIYHKKEPNHLTVELLAEIEASDKILLDLHFHDLRHEATSRLAEKFQMQDLMKVTGHKSSSMLSRYYHPRASDLAHKLG